MQFTNTTTSLIIPQKSSDSFIYHILKGFYDSSIPAKVKGVKLITLAMNNPVPHFFRFLRHDMSKLTPEIDFLDNFTLVNRFLSSYFTPESLQMARLHFGSYLSQMLMDFASIWVIL